MIYRKTIYIQRQEYDEIHKYMTQEPMDEACTLPKHAGYTKTAIFEDGTKMKICVNGTEYVKGRSNKAIAKAVLFRKGDHEICAYTAPSSVYIRTWELHHKGNTYMVDIKLLDTLIHITEKNVDGCRTNADMYLIVSSEHPYPVHDQKILLQITLRKIKERLIKEGENLDTFDMITNAANAVFGKNNYKIIHPDIDISF